MQPTFANDMNPTFEFVVLPMTLLNLVCCESYFLNQTFEMICLISCLLVLETLLWSETVSLMMAQAAKYGFRLLGPSCQRSLRKTLWLQFWAMTWRLGGGEGAWPREVWWRDEGAWPCGVWGSSSSWLVNWSDRQLQVASASGEGIKKC